MRVVLALIMFSAAACAQAEAMHAFKAVHADGTVSYSDTRPATQDAVKKMTIHQNSAAIEQQGAQRVQEMDAAGKELEKQRAGDTDARRKYQSRVAEARQEVADAENYLVTAQQSKKHATPERIADAEERVRLARQRLREVQTAGP